MGVVKCNAGQRLAIFKLNCDHNGKSTVMNMTYFSRCILADFWFKCHMTCL